MKKEQEIKINKVEIKIGDKTLSLSIEEVLELKNILNKYFGLTSIEQCYNPITIINPMYIPYVPLWNDAPPWTVTCKNDTLQITS